MNTQIKHKRGDTFLLDGRFADYDNGNAIDLTGKTLASQLRQANGNLVQDFDIILQPDALGEFQLKASAVDTEAWPLGEELEADIEMTDANGNVASTDTFLVMVIQDITHV